MGLSQEPEPQVTRGKKVLRIDTLRVDGFGVYDKHSKVNFCSSLEKSFPLHREQTTKRV